MDQNITVGNEVMDNEFPSVEQQARFDEKKPRKSKKRKICIAVFSVIILAVFCVIVTIFSSPKIRTEMLINFIGTVTLESEQKIKRAEKAFAKLNDKDKENLRNRDSLVSARDSYDNIKLAYDAINKVGTVSLDNENSIISARTAFEACNDDEKKYVTNIDVLEEAENKLSELKIEEVITAIQNIGEVTLKSEADIKTIRNLYNKLSSEQQGLVTNLEDLEKSENQLSILQIEEAEAAIKKIGKVTLKKEKAIEAAEDIYNALSYGQQLKVSNTKTLTSARAEFNKLLRKEKEKKEEEKKNKAKNAFSKLKSKYDNVEEITWYQPKAYPYYVDTRSFVLPYIGRKDNGYTWMRLRYLYTGDDWIFWEKAIIKIDGEKYYEYAGTLGTERDNDTEVWEYLDVAVGETEIEMLEKIANSKETIVRFQGDNYHYDLTVSSSDKQAIKDVLKAYEYAEYLD